MSAEITLTSGNFEQEVLKSSLPVLVDFWAPWCGPCKMISPIVDQFAVDQAGKIKVGKVNVDEQSDLATRYGISTIPSLFIFKNGEVLRKKVGALRKQDLEEFCKGL